MALFTDIVFDKYTGQYEFIFVNQQYDFLMRIYYDKETGAYRFSCGKEEAKRIAMAEGGWDDFDVDYWLEKAATDIKNHAGGRKTDG